MLNQTLGANVNNMVSGCFSQFCVPPEESDRLCSVEVLNGLIDSSRAFLGAQSGLARLAQRVSLEAAQHLLQVGNERARVTPQSVRQLKNLTVKFLHVCGKRCVNLFCHST